MKSKSAFVIPFVGLKLGIHQFDFELHDAFFEELDYALIQKGQALVKLSLDKKETMLIGEFFLSGQVQASCDRCSDPVQLPLVGSFRLIFKFGDESSDDESLIVLPNDAYELDIRQHIYELIVISLPLRMVHSEGECNQEMIDLLDKYSGFDSSSENEDGQKMNDNNKPSDPRWSALKNLN